MPQIEISKHEVEIWRTLKESKGWMTNKLIENKANGVAKRTVRHHTKRFTALTILEMAETFPTHSFHINPSPSEKALEYIKRLDRAIEIFDSMK